MDFRGPTHDRCHWTTHNWGKRHLRLQYISAFSQHSSSLSHPWWSYSLPFVSCISEAHWGVPVVTHFPNAWKAALAPKDAHNSMNRSYGTGQERFTYLPESLLEIYIKLGALWLNPADFCRRDHACFFAGQKYSLLHFTSLKRHKVIAEEPWDSRLLLNTRNLRNSSCKVLEEGESNHKSQHKSHKKV